jgi:phage N-6-adenine-methyltransferase
VHRLAAALGAGWDVVLTEPKQKPGRSKQDYGTPPDLIEAIRREFGITFILDVAASPENTKAPAFISKEQDGLKTPWSADGWNWCNPEFAAITPWVRRAFQQHNFWSTVLLVPAAVGSNWWASWVHEKAHVVFLNGRVKFVGCADYYPKDCALLFYGAGVVKGYDVWRWRDALKAVA